MKYQGFLVRRYLTSRVIPYFAVLAVALGVFVLISALSVMEGFKHEMRGRIRGSLSHLTVTGDVQMALYDDEEILQELQKLEHVEYVAPYVSGMGLFRSRVLDTCVFRGIDPVAESVVGGFAEYLLRPDEWMGLLMDDEYKLPLDRKPLSEEEIRSVFSREHRRRIFGIYNGEGAVATGKKVPQPIIVGIEALRHRTMQFGQTIKISSYSPLDLKPKAEDFLVVGAFRTGVFEQDIGWIYMPLRAAQEFLDVFDEELGYRFSGVSVKLDDYQNAEAVKQVIEEEVSTLLSGRELQVKTWEEQRATLLKAVDIEKTIIFVMMLFIVAFAGAMIFLILALMAIEKTRDIGVLQSLGATPGGIVGIFLRLGMMLTVVGVLLGGVSGWIFTEYINDIHDWIFRATGYQLFPPDIYYLTEIPVKRSPRDLGLILGTALLFGFLGSTVPAIWASRKDPVRTLRYE